ncbi:hypothetical protein GCM10023321_18360 [Pseudonocardia eucalypti]|uniref:Uncharacterized protein n=1 Tax=Pseudonocardia eucalypti TaxID=648755 RepID=A0ABP9PXB3_9PSEU
MGRGLVRPNDQFILTDITDPQNVSHDELTMENGTGKPRLRNATGRARPRQAARPRRPSRS